MCGKQEFVTNPRIKLLSFLAIIIAAVMAIGDMGFHIASWSLWHDTTRQAVLQAYSDLMPALIAKGFKQSLLSEVLYISLDTIPLIISTVSYVLIGILFFRLAKGEIWSNRNISASCIIGFLMILEQLLYPVINTLQGMALSVDLVKGQRVFSFSFGVNSESLFIIMFGVFLLIFSLIMHESKKISDEQRYFI
ncbi:MULTISPECIES: hypothetical protein [Photorhabdus]|uniref:DUF2975 domain-containing protein n=4 Tax=Photorhabdus TaxID=29487 RepID=A0A4R4K411_9GAMM|nr:MULTISPECIES: hypothetical protein [Photorhabdus]OHV56089.1 hypothetical protein BB987_05745 [Photorhabdus temperata]ETS33292.1 Protein of unknown function (DUF2975) [Photorhabdus khanii NC19]MQL47827.1 hypothetical protein [Photorhabdus khanii]NHB96790.1 hypothetical protein [Photorhabdus stackebrandtii]TDB62144.1 hypothetical protein C5467_03050 [Photorhabdus khanii subsp. guanajuatensis]